MATHAQAFLDALELKTCDVLGFSLGGMVAQQMALERPSIFRRMILVGTAPRGGEDIMHLDKPSIAKHLGDPTLKGYAVLQKIFFAPTNSSQSAGAAFIRAAHATQSKIGSPSLGRPWLRRNWQHFVNGSRHRASGLRISRTFDHPTLVVNGIYDDMIPGLELILAERPSAERGAHDLSGLRAWLAVPVP